MADPAPSAASRYRPAILALTGVAAAYAIWLIYMTAEPTPPEPLHRSNAVRRSNPRGRRVPSMPTEEGPPDGPGRSHPILDLSPDDIRQVVRIMEPDIDPEEIDGRIRNFYETIGSPEPTRQDEHNALDNGDADSVAPTELGEWSSDDEDEGQTFQRTLYYIAEDRAKHVGVIHRGITCNTCDTKPIRGIRWHCANCADFDLCSDCEASDSHDKTHVFYKIVVPIPNLNLPKQKPLYPGRPDMMSPSLPALLKKRLVSESQMEVEEIEARWDHFKNLASVVWVSDPNHIGWAIDKRTFNSAFVPRYSRFKSEPTLAYDRIFAYFDTDHNGLIGCEEFIKGVDGMQARDRQVRLRIAFNGYDIDGDGYISRKDVLRMFRSNFVIEQEATRNYLSQSADELPDRPALDVIRSAQPLGAAFTQGFGSQQPGLTRQSKPSDDEMETLHLPVVASDRPNVLDRETVLGNDSGERWARRRFYLDEEEGFTRPADATDDTHLDEQPAVEPGRTRSSRSSSRVRFQNGIDVETRSNASTSSRPIGERFGGFELPEPEEDLGKDTFYQYSQLGYNEMLDAMFGDKEDAAMNADALWLDRGLHAPVIEEVILQFKSEEISLRKIWSIGIYLYFELLLKEFCSGHYMTLLYKNFNGPSVSPESDFRRYFAEADLNAISKAEQYNHAFPRLASENQLWLMMMYKVRFQQELMQATHQLALREGWITAPDPAPAATSDVERKDPTLPQHRPNSAAEASIDTTASPKPTDGSIDPKRDWHPFFIFDYVPDLKPVEGDATDTALEFVSVPGVGITLFGPQPFEEPSIVPSMFTLSIDHTTSALKYKKRLVRDHPHAEPDGWSGPACNKFHRPIRNYAMKCEDDELWYIALASLHWVDRERKERNGDGLVNFEEFESNVMDGAEAMRYMESWIDWASF